MAETLKYYCPSGKVIGIEAHHLGPVHAVRMVQDNIDDNMPVIVNYCDFTCYWDYPSFLKMTQETGCAGAIPAYRGFHPHSLGTTNYAYMREKNLKLLDIKEKEPFTDNRMSEFASSGTYYFSSGAVMKNAFQACVDLDLSINGEFYVSLAYKPLLANNEDIRVFEVPYFMQWGTPEDLSEYVGWSEAFRQMMQPRPSGKGINHAVIIPMAGLGMRFQKEGYDTTKPLIAVKDMPMVLAATHDLPKAEHYIFVMRADMPGLEDIKEAILSIYPHAIIIELPTVTQGQAMTCLAGLEALEREIPTFDGVITFGACDNGMLYNDSVFEQWLEEPDSDLLVWAARGHVNAVRHPEMFGWIDATDKKIKSVSVKAPLSDPKHDPIITGTVSFKSGAHFKSCLSRLIERDGRVNQEFYLDSTINDAIDLDLDCRIMEIDHYISWGTPNDLRSFNYWQNCFQKWAGHPFEGFVSVHR